MANKRLNAVITIGGAVAGSLKAAIGSTQSQIGRIGEAVSKLRQRQTELNNVIKEQERLGRSGSALRVQLAQQELAQIDKQISKLKQRQALESRIGDAKRANAARRADLRGQAFDAVVIGAALAAPVQQAIKFENAMLGVAKQVDGARDESGKLTAVYHEMGRAIQQLGTEVPMATNSLAEMVTAGARMGVPKDQLIEFTRVAAKMAEAFEAEPAELADNMGKIAGLYKIPIPAISSLADTINYLDDNAISKGKDIIEYLQRVGGVAGAVKVTGTQMAALGSTLLTLGERTETASTATNAMFQKFAAADKGTKKFKASMKEIGLSTAKVQKGMQTDAQGTILTVLEAINKLPKDKQLGVMVELVGLEHSDTLAKLAGNVAEYRKQIALADSEKAKGSMDREFQARLATTGAQLKIATNRVTELSVELGSALLPAINETLKAVGPYVTQFAAVAREHPGVTKAIVGTVGALVVLKIATVAGGFAFTVANGAFLAARGLMLALPAAATAASVGMKMIGLSATTSAASVGALSLALKGAGAAAAAAFAAYELYQLGKAGVDLYQAKNREGVVLSPESQARIKRGEVAGNQPKPGAMGSGSFGLEMPPLDVTGIPAATPDADKAPPPLPQMPPMATARTQAPIYTDSSTHTYTITQQPGQSISALADELERRRKREQGVAKRSMMFDGAN